MAKRIAIIGAGPVGLEAALYGRNLGHDVVVYERGLLAQNVRSWGFVRLFSPWRMNTTPLGLRAVDAHSWFDPVADQCPTGEQLRQRYLMPLSASEPLKGLIRTGVSVITIGRDDYGKGELIGQPARAQSPFRILLRESDGTERIEHADIVLDCSGTYGNHRWAGRGGILAPGERRHQNKIWYTLPDVLGHDRASFANKHTLVVGAGFSAATLLMHLAELEHQHPGTRVSWAIRRPGQAFQAVENDPLDARRELVEASLRTSQSPPPWLQFLGNCVLESVNGVEPFDVTLKFMNTDLVLQVDQVVALVGYTPDDEIYKQLQVHQCYATAGPMKLSAALLGENSPDCLSAGQTLGPEAMKNPEPGFFILGAKSFGTNSNFLLQIGHRQVRDVFRLIQNAPDLDLYEQSPL